MRIALVISSLDPGGAERVLALMANHWAGKNHVVSLITLSPIETDWYPLHPAIMRVGLNCLSIASRLSHAVWHNVRRIVQLRRQFAACRAEVIVSFMDLTNVLTLLAGCRQGIPMVVCERTDPRQRPIGFAWNRLRALTYPYAAGIVVQSQALKPWAAQFAREQIVHVIPNPVRPLSEGQAHIALRRGTSRTVIAMGRLTGQKGFDLLLSAFAACLARHPQWSLTILGEGEERSRLEAQATELGIAERVSLPGVVRHPEDALREADLFVLSSRYEGFPNALLEAMACGLAVIATDCPTGPGDIIRDGEDGILVAPNDVHALSAAMDRLMREEDLRQRLGACAKHVVTRFSMERVMGMWDQVIATTLTHTAAALIR